MSKSGVSTVRWTNQEWVDFVKRIKEIDPTWQGQWLGSNTLFNIQNSLFKDDRLHNEKFFWNRAKLGPRIFEIYQRLPVKESKPSTQVLPVVEKPVASPVVKSVPVDSIGQALAILVQALRTEMQDEMKAMKIALHEEMKNAILAQVDIPEKLVASVETKKESTTKSLPRILVCGLLPIQYETLSEKITSFEIRSYDGSSTDKMKSMIRWADTVFIMSKFTSHALQKTITNEDRSKLKYCNGGVSELIRMINFIN